MVVSAEFLRHFSKDMEIARNADAATDDHELSHEIGLLCKGTVIDSTNVHRLTIEDLVERRRQVAACVKKHREIERERKKKTKEEAKAAAKPAPEAPKIVTAAQQRQQQAQADALGKQQEGPQATLPLGDQARASLHLPPAPLEKRERASRLDRMPSRTTRTSKAPGLAVLPLPVLPRATAGTALQVAALAKGRRPVRLG